MRPIIIVDLRFCEKKREPKIQTFESLFLLEQFEVVNEGGAASDVDAPFRRELRMTHGVEHGGGGGRRVKLRRVAGELGAERGQRGGSDEGRVLQSHADEVRALLDETLPREFRVDGAEQRVRADGRAVQDRAGRGAAERVYLFRAGN